MNVLAILLIELKEKTLQNVMEYYIIFRRTIFKNEVWYH
jgi:hypothetical protein